MLRPFRVLLSFFLLAMAGSALSQQGAAKYGQGMGGGQGGYAGGAGRGGGGGYGGIAGQGYVPANQQQDPAPDADPRLGLWESKTAILTPGDRVEYKLKVVKGETVMAGVISDAFDPALAIEDSKGNTIAKNDDREEGNQSPFLSYRFTEAGSYTLKVISYRPVSGGKFTLRMRTFVSTDVGFGPEKHSDITPVENIGVQYSQQTFSEALIHIAGKKGHVYDLRDFVGVQNFVDKFETVRRIYGPTGVDLNDFAIVPAIGNDPVFRALTDGDYYVEITWSNQKELDTDVHEVKVLQAQASGKLTLSLGPRELQIVEFPVLTNQIIRSKLDGSFMPAWLTGPADKPGGVIQNSAGETQSYGNSDSWAWFTLNRDSTADVIRVFHVAGVARLAIRNYYDRERTVEFSNTESLPEWKSGETLKSSLEIGDARLFLIKSTKSDLMRVFAQASHFQAKVEIFRLSGSLENTLINRQTHTAGDDLYFPDADTFIIRFSCDGDGGSGDFVLKRDSLQPAPYKLGEAKLLDLNGQNFGYYDVNLEAGKRYELIYDTAQYDLRADLLDEAGEFLTSQRIGFAKVEVQYFVTKRPGRHRLWLRGTPGKRKFKLQLSADPTV